MNCLGALRHDVSLGLINFPISQILASTCFSVYDKSKYVMLSVFPEIHGLLHSGSRSAQMHSEQPVTSYEL